MILEYLVFNLYEVKVTLTHFQDSLCSQWENTLWDFFLGVWKKHTYIYFYYLHTQEYACLHVSACMCMCLCVCTRARVCVHVYTRMRVRTYVGACMHEGKERDHSFKFIETTGYLSPTGYGKGHSAVKTPWVSVRPWRWAWYYPFFETRGCCTPVTLRSLNIGQCMANVR